MAADLAVEAAAQAASADTTHPEIAIADVAPQHVLMLWPLVREYIEKVLRRDPLGRYQASDILDVLLRHQARLWVAWNTERDAPDAAVITEIVDFPRVRELRIWLVGGRPGTLRSWAFEMRDQLEAFARSQRCAVIAGSMRKGWLRIGGEGWKETGTTFEKALGDG